MMHTESLLERIEKLSKSKDDQLLLDPTPPDANYFSRLHCSFTSSESTINSQYVKMFKKFSESYDPTLPLSENTTLRRAVRLVSAYKIIMSPKVFLAEFIIIASI